MRDKSNLMTNGESVYERIERRQGGIGSESPETTPETLEKLGKPLETAPEVLGKVERVLSNKEAFLVGFQIMYSSARGMALEAVGAPWIKNKEVAATINGLFGLEAQVIQEGKQVLGEVFDTLSQAPGIKEVRETLARSVSPKGKGKP